MPKRGVEEEKKKKTKTTTKKKKRLEDGDGKGRKEEGWKGTKEGWSRGEETRVKPGTGLVPAFHSHWPCRSLYRWSSSSSSLRVVVFLLLLFLLVVFLLCSLRLHFSLSIKKKKESSSLIGCLLHFLLSFLLHRLLFLLLFVILLEPPAQRQSNRGPLGSLAINASPALTLQNCRIRARVRS